MIGWCYRIRLKGNLILQHAGGEIISGDIPRFAPQGIKDAELNSSGVLTHIRTLHEKVTKPHGLLRIIAMNDTTSARVLDYGMRWGIEALFSDFKSTGFGITTTRLQHAERIERLILVLTIAIFFAVSTAMQPDENTPKYTKKNLSQPDIPVQKGIKTHNKGKSNRKQHSNTRTMKI